MRRLFVVHDFRYFRFMRDHRCLTRRMLERIHSATIRYFKMFEREKYPNVGKLVFTWEKMRQDVKRSEMMTQNQMCNAFDKLENEINSIENTYHLNSGFESIVVEKLDMGEVEQ